ncbi:MAG: ACT domain-containing protein [Candidatus Micrarchaeota archaeon]
MTVSDLHELIKNMKPELVHGRFFIASVGQHQLMVLANYLDYIEAVFREKEGMTLVFSEGLGDVVKPLSDYPISGPFALIMLTVNSDLFAVGFLAKITTALAAKGISVNAYSAYHHDHLLVPFERKEETMEILAALSKSSK